MRLCLLATLGFALASPVHAQPNSDYLADCLVASSTGADRVNMARWVAFAILAHPSIADSVAIPKVEIDLASKKMAEILARLLTVDCERQAIAAFEESPSGFEEAFSLMGQVAMYELMNNSAVANRLEGFVEYVDPRVFERFE